MKANRILAFALLCWTSVALSIPLEEISIWGNANKNEFKKANASLLVAKGSTDDLLYILEVDPVTGALPVSGSFTLSLTYDTNWGAVGVDTLRTASILGNETGLADFGSGVVSAQTLRATLATDVDVPMRPLASGTDSVSAVQSGSWTVGITGTVPLPTGAATEATLQSVDTTLTTLNGKVANDYGVSTGAVRTASQIGNATGAADFDAGTTSAQTLRVVLPTDQTAIPASQSGSWTVGITGTVPLPSGAATEATLSALNGKVANDFGANSGAIRAASQLGNSTGEIDYGSGAATTQTPRVVLSTRQESASTPVAARLSNGTSFLDTGTGAAGSTTLRVVESADSNPRVGKAAVNRARNVYSSSSVTTSAYVQLIASTSATVSEIEIFDSSGQTLVLATGGSGSEVDQAYILPGGNGRIPLAIASGTRVSVKAVSATASVGELTINFYGI